MIILCERATMLEWTCCKIVWDKGDLLCGNVPFRRVKSDEVLINRKLSNNSFEAKKGAAGSWGEKAHRDLKHTQGKSFKREKGKKKKGQYRGGSIDTSVNSVKFDSDSD